MRTFSTVLISAFSLLVTLNATSQDKIYLKNSARQGKILAINESFITYRPTSEKSQTTNIPLRNVVLLFNEKGGYIVPLKMNFKDDKSQNVVNSFLNQDTSFWPADRIYTTEKTLQQGIVRSETDKEIQIEYSGILKKIDRKNVALIIYKSGKHTILSSAETGAEILQSQDGSFAAVSFVTSAPKQPANKIDSSSAGKTQVTDTSIAAARPISIDNFLSEDLKKLFEIRATQKTKDFQNYLNVLCDKTSSPQKMDDAEEGALALFINENVIIEASSLNRDKLRKRPIRTYLTEVRNLKYDHIEIQWTNVQYVDKLKLATDGTYRGIVTFEQKFSGFKDGQLVYSDITEKRTEIVVKSYKKIVDGRSLTDWDVLLSNISVMATVPI